MKRLLLVSTCLLASALSVLAQAQENIYRAKAGAKQMGFMGNGTNANGVSTHDLIAEGGYYVNEKFVAVGRLGFSKHSPEKVSMFLGGRYELKSSGAAIPYFQAGVEFHQGDRYGQVSAQFFAPDDDPSGTFFQAGMGMNFFLNSATCGFIEVSAIRGSVGGVGSNVQIGIRAFFK